VVILGRGASGKSTLARRLGSITGLPVIELDKVFWRPDLVANTPRSVGRRARSLSRKMDGSWMVTLVPTTLSRFGFERRTLIFLDFSLVRCSWRAVRRSCERADLWRWLLAYRCQSRPILMQAIANHAATADLRVLRDPEALRRFVADVARESRS
jgi:adenylate kinase family enzyme